HRTISYTFFLKSYRQKSILYSFFPISCSKKAIVWSFFRKSYRQKTFSCRQNGIVDWHGGATIQRFYRCASARVRLLLSSTFVFRRRTVPCYWRFYREKKRSKPLARSPVSRSASAVQSNPSKCSVSVTNAASFRSIPAQ